MRILIAPDKFKGSLSAKKAAEAIARGFRQVFPEFNCHLLPLADGGEGLLDAFQENGNFTLKETTVQDALGRPVTASWLLRQDTSGLTAIIESSLANGLWRIAPSDRDPPVHPPMGSGSLSAKPFRQVPTKSSSASAAAPPTMPESVLPPL